MQNSAYPPGTYQNDPAAPWNQNPALDPDSVQAVIDIAHDLFEALKDLRDIDASWFKGYQPLGRTIGYASEIIERLKEVYAELLGD